MIAYNYARVSSDTSAESGMSEKFQLDAARKFYDDHLAAQGYTWGRQFFDPAVSCSTPLLQREGGAELDRTMKAGDCVIFFAMRRGFGSITDCMPTVLRWQERRIRVVFLDMGGGTVDTASPIGKFLLAALAYVAEMEMAYYSERRHQTVRRQRADGRHLGDYGYKGVKTGSTPHVKTWACPDIKSRLLWGWASQAMAARMPVEDIRESLIQLGVPRRKGSTLRPCSIYNTITAERRLQDAEELAGAGWKKGLYLLPNGSVRRLEDFRPAVQNEIRRGWEAVGLPVPTPPEKSD